MRFCQVNVKTIDQFDQGVLLPHKWCLSETEVLSFSGLEIRCLVIEGMGCASSKRILRTKSFQQNFDRPFPRVAAIPIIEDFLLANNHEQFVALICKNNNFTTQVPAAAKQETLPSSISNDNEGKGVVSGNLHMVRLDLQSGSSLRVEESEKDKLAEEESEKLKAAVEESEEYKATEQEKLEIINIWELMEGLEDGEADHTSEKPANNGDGTRVIRTAGRSKSMECFHTLEEWELMKGLEDEEADHTFEKPTGNGDGTRVSRKARRSKSMEYFHTLEEFDAVVARSKISLWDRNSKRYFYFLGHKCLETVTKSTLSSEFRTSSLPPKSPKPRNLTPTVIDWKEDSKDDHNCALESSVLQVYSDQSDTGNEVSSPENNSIAEIVPENTIGKENKHLVEANEGKFSSAEMKIEKKQFIYQNSIKRSLHERAKVNDLGGISIPSSPDFSAVGSLREWLNGGGHLFSPSVSTTPTFGSYFCGDRLSIPNPAGNSEQFRIDEVEIEMHSFSALEKDKQASIIMDSGVCSGSSLSAIEKENWDNPLFDPELLASFEWALEQLRKEEKSLLRQIDGSSHFWSMDSHPDDSDDGLHDSSKMGGIPIQNNCPSHPQEVLAAS